MMSLYRKKTAEATCKGKTALLGLAIKPTPKTPSLQREGASRSEGGGFLLSLLLAFSLLVPYLALAQAPTNGVSGSGTLISFRFKVLESTNGSITLNMVDGRGPNDEAISITSIRGAYIDPLN